MGARPIRLLFLVLLALTSVLASAQLSRQLGDRGYMGRNSRFGAPSREPILRTSGGSKIWGIDVSYWEGTIDFSQVKTAASFVVIRASFGAPDAGESLSQYTDQKFTRNRQQAEAQGLEVGFYHYSYPQYNTPADEAKCFCDVVGQLKTGQFVVLDFEETYSGDYAAWCKAWLDAVKARLGVKPLIYLNVSTARGHDWSSVISADYGLWLARWDYDKNAAAPTTPWPFVAMRQYSDHETIPGISGVTDADVFYGSLDSLKRYGFQQSVPAAVAWGALPAAGRWYRSNETLPYTVTGDRPNTVNETVDGATKATLDSSGSSMTLSEGTAGWHDYTVSAYNSVNASTPSTTSKWTGGYDPSAPTAAWKGGASPGTWYTSPQSVTFQAQDSLSGVKRYRYHWDADAFSDWVNGSSGSIPLTQGKHRLYVEVEDNAYYGTDASGNRAAIDLGEYWLDLNPATLNVTAQVVSSSATEVDVQITLTNPNLAPVVGVGIDRADLGYGKSEDAPLDLGDIAGQSAVTRVLRFGPGFDKRWPMMLQVAYHMGARKLRFAQQM